MEFQLKEIQKSLTIENARAEIQTIQEKQIPLFHDPEVGMVYGNVWQFFEEKNKKKIYKKGNLPTGKILNELFGISSIANCNFVLAI